MEILNAGDVEAKRIETFPYKGKSYDVKDVTIKWLSQAGFDPNSPEYGLRSFTVGPKGMIPIHQHFYFQTMYMLTGELIIYSHDRQTDGKVKEKRIGPHDFVFVPSMEPHSMINPSEKEEATFLCCIANVYENEGEEGL